MSGCLDAGAALLLLLCGVVTGQRSASEGQCGCGGTAPCVSGRSQWVWQGTRVDRGCSVLKASEDRTICRGTGPGAGSKSACLLLTSYEAVTRSLISAVLYIKQSSVCCRFSCANILRLFKLINRLLHLVSLKNSNHWLRLVKKCFLLTGN